MPFTLGVELFVSLSDWTFLTWISSLMCFLLDSYRLWGRDFRRSIGRWLNDVFTQVRLLVFFSGLTQTTVLSCHPCNYPQWGKQMCQKGQHSSGNISFCICRTVHDQSFKCIMLHGGSLEFFCNSCYLIHPMNIAQYLGSWGRPCGVVWLCEQWRGRRWMSRSVL